MELEQLYAAPEDENDLKTVAAGNKRIMLVWEMAFSKLSPFVAVKIGCMAMVQLAPLHS